MKKRLIQFAAAFLFSAGSLGLQAQNQGVVIGGASPSAVDPAAILWLIGDGTQGLILPKVANTGAVGSPKEGMVVYSTSDAKIYYYTGSTWVATGAGGSSALLKVTGN